MDKCLAFSTFTNKNFQSPEILKAILVCTYTYISRQSHAYCVYVFKNGVRVIHFRQPKFRQCHRYRRNAQPRVCVDEKIIQNPKRSTHSHDTGCLQCCCCSSNSRQTISCHHTMKPRVAKRRYPTNLSGTDGAYIHTYAYMSIPKIQARTYAFCRQFWLLYTYSRSYTHTNISLYVCFYICIQFYFCIGCCTESCILVSAISGHNYDCLYS